MHLDNHVKCVVEGCKFEALPREVAKHLLTFHQYNTGAGGSKSSIDKWVEARKRNFPSQETIEGKERRDEARMERGEILETRNQFGKFKVGPMDKAKRPKEATEATSSASHTQGERGQGINQLIEKLLAEEIRHERNVLLQCIRYIMNHSGSFGMDDTNEKTETGSQYAGEQEMKGPS